MPKLKPMLQICSAICLLLVGCQSKKDSAEVLKKEIYDTETAFSKMAGEVGIAEAFVHFADDSAVLLRNNQLIKGKAAIKELYRKDHSGSDLTSLTWKPDFTEVSASGDLGYTYGRYVYTFTDSLGKETVNEGIFHTVWKKQEDGTWRFVWD